MGQAALEHVGEDLHVAVPVGPEALGRLHAVLVDDPEGPEAHVLGVVVVGEGEGVVAVEPAVVGVAPLVALANLDHGREDLTQPGAKARRWPGNGPSRDEQRVQLR